MSSPAPLPPANWYPDPADPARLRYWDGARWTENTAPAVSASAPAPAPVPLGPGERPYASFGRRLGGLVIDQVLLSIPLLILTYSVLAPIIDDMMARLNALGPNPTPEQTNALANEIAAAVPVQTLVGIALISAALYLLYYGISLHLWGRAIGGQLVGIRCVTAAGEYPSWGQSFSRQGVVAGLNLLGAVPLVGFLASILLLVNYLSMLWHPQRQCWMDRVAGTYVVRA